MTVNDQAKNDQANARRDPGVRDADHELLADRRTEQALAATLGGLRQARPSFQDALQARLVSRLAAPPAQWWRRALDTLQPAPGRVRMSRRTMFGAAAAGALSLFAISLAAPLGGQPPEVSAREILEKVQAASNNPLLAGVKSFHLTATSTSTRRNGNVAAVTTEQWFVEPNKMRTETRTKQSDGSTALSGFVHDGSKVRQYSSGNGREAAVVGVVGAPVGAPFGKEPLPDHPAGSPPLSPGGAQPFDPSAKPAGPVVMRPPDGKPAGEVPGKPEPADILVIGRDRAAPPDRQSDGGRVVIARTCPEPQRRGEATVAGRPVFVVEADMSQCAPEGAPDELLGRHVRWVDQKTFLPLKMEMYDRSGTLVDRYEVTSIEYDVSIPDSIFTQLPAGTTPREITLPPLPDGSRPSVLPAGPPSR